MNMLRNAVGKLWGPSQKVIKWMYETMIVPIVTYGAVVWAHRAHFYRKYLNRVQRVAMLAMGAFARSTPTMGLELLYDFMPLDIRATVAATKAANRIQGRNIVRWDSVGHGVRRGHLYYVLPHSI